jgi:NitT/TauT family transport system permease protein
MRFSPERVQKISIRVGSLIVFALAWEWAAGQMHSLLVPGFFATMRALLGLLLTPDLWHSLWVSNQAMFLGFALGAGVGIPLGLLMGRWPIAARFLDPYLNILLVVPMAALIPIIIMATGIGILSRALIVFAFVFVVITVNTVAGLRTLDPTWSEMARSFGATEFQMWRKIFLRGALPAILTGMRQGLARAIAGMLIVELLLLALGIGRMVLDYQSTFDSAHLYATVLVIIGEAVLLMQGCKWLEQRAAPWLEQAAAE